MLEITCQTPATLHVARALLVNNSQEIILTRRVAKSGEAYGKLELPGGKFDKGETFDKDETFDQTVVREVAEETGLAIVPYGPINVAERRLMQSRPGSPYSGYKLTLVSRALITGGSLQPQASEVSEIVQLAIPEIARITHELTEPTIRALGMYGLGNFENRELPGQAA